MNVEFGFGSLFSSYELAVEMRSLVHYNVVMELYHHLSRALKTHELYNSQIWILVHHYALFLLNAGYRLSSQMNGLIQSYDCV